MQRFLKDITWQDFVKNRVTNINTWPYLPSGILKKHEEYDLSKLTDENLKFHQEEWQDVEKFVEHFSERQKSSLGWIFAAFIAVLGNLAINLGFATPIFEGNAFWMLVCLLIVATLTWTYLMYLPTPSLVFRFIPLYVNFPEGYEQRIPTESCINPHSKIILQYRDLHELVIGFGILVRAAILRDYLSSSLNKASYVRISNIREISDQLPAYFITISTNGIKPWLNPHGREHIRTELRDLVQALLDARTKCGVRRFELDPEEWSTRGADFVDGVSDWKIDDIRRKIISSLHSV